MVHDWGERPPPKGLDEDTWLDAREVFWSRHFMIAGAEGARLPNVALLREDDQLVASWRPPQFLREPRVTMLHHSGEAHLRWAEVSEVLNQLVEYVSRAFVEAGRQDAYPWITSQSPLSIGQSDDEKLRLFCARGPEQLASLLGVPVPELRDVLGLAPCIDDPARSPACQVIRDLPPIPSAAIGSEILNLVAAVRATHSSPRAPWRRLRDIARDAARAGRLPEEQGQLAAQTLREELGLDGEPIESTETLLARCEILERPSDLVTSGERMIVASFADSKPALSVLRTRRTERVWGRRFEHVRAMGHLLLDPERGGALGAASSPYAQELRRRRSGAFAAEFLLPTSALERLSDGRLDGAADYDVFSGLLSKYGVGARTAAHQLYNHQWLSGPNVRDDLIETFAAHDP